MRKGLLRVAFVALFGWLSVSTAVAENASADGKCLAVEFKALVKQVRAKAQCHERSLRLGVPVSQECLNRAVSRHRRLVEKVHRSKGCQSLQDDGATLQLRIDEFLRDMRVAIESKQSLKAVPTPKAATPAPPSPGGKDVAAQRKGG